MFAPTHDLPCLSAHAQGCCLALSVVPNARRTELVGLHDGLLRVRLAAAPVDARANAALIAWLAGSLGLPRAAVQLRSGAASRRKRVLVAAQVEHVAAWLRAQLA